MTFTLFEDSTTIRVVSSTSTLILNRSTGFGTSSRKSDAHQTKHIRKSQIIGILGLIKLRNSSYMVCITGSKQIGLYLNYPVFEVTKVSIIKFKTHNTKESDARDLSNILRFFKQPGFIYSEYPIYKSYVDQNCNEVDFLFNCEWINEFEEAVKGSIDPYVLKCMQGYFGSRVSKNITLNLISRRCWKRAGIRYFSRGCDDTGYPSNFVETEQVLYDGENVISFLQVRGSIPIIWKQKMDFKINPDIQVLDSVSIEKAHEIFCNHYGDVFYLNLIQHVNGEKVLNDAFKKEMYKRELNFLNFDFKNQNMEKSIFNREKFIRDLHYLIDKQGMTINADEEQSGIIRTNCIDCLDRTNIVQFLIGVEGCKRQVFRLEQLSDSKNDPKVEDLTEEMSLLMRELWFENGNTLSIQYSGTPSLKNTIIRGGNQTFFGIVRDCFHSLQRYYLNRFSHGRLQDGYYLVTGTHQRMERKKRFRINFITLILIMAIIFMCLQRIIRDNSWYYGGTTVFLGGFVFFRIFFDWFLVYPLFVEKRNKE